MAVDVKAHLDDLSVRLDRLRILYEQYFMGIEKQAPTVARREVEKVLDFLGRQNIGNTAIRFRYLGLLRKWKTYAERWDKILREIENGTYAPHRMRVERAKQAEKDKQASRAAAIRDKLPAPMGSRGPGTEGAGGEEDGVPEAMEPTPSGRMVAVARPSAIPGMSEPDLRALHARYVEARRAAGEAKPEVRYETLVTTLSRQLPQILERNHCDSVGFDVIVRDGKVVLKALPRR